MLEGLLIGLQAALSLQDRLMAIGGCLIGTFIGMLPGLGPMPIIAIMTPVAISLGDPSAALILLAGGMARSLAAPLPLFCAMHRGSRVPLRQASMDIRWRGKAKRAKR